MNPQIAVYRRMTINRHWRDSKVTTATRATCEALRWGRAMLCRDLDIRTQPYKLCFVPKSKSFYGWAILPSWKGLKWSKMQFFSPFFLGGFDPLSWFVRVPGKHEPLAYAPREWALHLGVLPLGSELQSARTSGFHHKDAEVWDLERWWKISKRWWKREVEVEHSRSCSSHWACCSFDEVAESTCGSLSDYIKVPWLFQSASFGGLSFHEDQGSVKFRYMSYMSLIQQVTLKWLMFLRFDLLIFALWRCVRWAVEALAKPC